NSDSNIMIRTLLTKKNKIYAWAGGGIIAQSNLKDEYQETLDKLDNIFKSIS
ncbi:MAG: chorismate-binding protein, partial [Legionellales bacterium]|nr:chorismate-binding protein [Legionellales bacterium]